MSERRTILVPHPLTGDIPIRRVRDRIRGALEDAGRVFLDFSNCEHIGSDALRMLVAEQRRAREEGGTLIVTNPGEEVRALLAGTRLDTLLPVEEDAGP